jgi:hypothetical protein
MARDSAMAGAHYYIRKGKFVSGPYTAADLKDLAASGDLHPNDEVRKGGRTAWIAAEKVKGLPFDRIARATATLGKVADKMEKANDTAARLNKLAVHVTTIVGACSGIVGAISDFLRPLANLNLWLFGAALLCTLALLLMSVLGCSTVWGLPVRRMATLTFVGVVAFGAWLGLEKTLSKDHQGVLATTIKPIGELQQEVLPAARPSSPPPTIPTPTPTPAPDTTPPLTNGAIEPGNILRGGKGVIVYGVDKGIADDLFNGDASGVVRFTMPVSLVVTLPKTYSLQQIRFNLADQHSWRYELAVSSDGRNFEVVGERTTGEH